MSEPHGSLSLQVVPRSWRLGLYTQTILVIQNVASPACLARAWTGMYITWRFIRPCNHFPLTFDDHTTSVV